MSLETLFRHEVTILRYNEANEQDEHGNAVTTFLADDVPTRGFLQADNETEIREGEEVIIAEWSFDTFPETQVTTQDRLKWGTRVFRIIGKLEEQSPGATHHITLLLEEVQGGPS